jgi:hypothetical protein
MGLPKRPWPAQVQQGEAVHTALAAAGLEQRPTKEEGARQLMVIVTRKLL